MTTSKMNRRDLMKLGVLSAAGLALTGKSFASNPLRTQPAAAPVQPTTARSIRIAHLTDFHIQPEQRAGEGVASCLKHVMSLADKPDLLITGGDLVMDSFEQEFGRTKTLWDLYTKVLKDECGIPVHHTLGNHDHWGWNKAKSKTTRSGRWKCSG
jgi:predicted MPP superfamily phosphohydrolase